MDRRIARALGHMEQQLRAPLTIAALAAEISLSPSRFVHLFRRDVGTTPARYLHVLRMLRARLLLERTSLAEREVMVLVGCSDDTRFSRDFRRFHGVVPGACRAPGPSAGTTCVDVSRPGTTEAVARVAALANERLHRPGKPQPRARSPDAPVKVATHIQT
jgi:AraC-like DNA-binding protein